MEKCACLGRQCLPASWGRDCQGELSSRTSSSHLSVALVNLFMSWLSIWMPERAETTEKRQRGERVEPLDVQRHVPLWAEQCSALCTSLRAQQTKNHPQPLQQITGTNWWQGDIQGITKQQGEKKKPTHSIPCKMWLFQRCQALPAPQTSKTDKQTHSSPWHWVTASWASHLLCRTRFGVCLDVPWYTGLGRDARAWQHHFLKASCSFLLPVP